MLAGQGGHFLIDIRPHHREAFSTMAKKGSKHESAQIVRFLQFRRRWVAQQFKQDGMFKKAAG
jgi:hypothetical protein